jgi:hypothetical protein
VLGEDGRYVTIGRANDPSDDVILTAESALRAQGVSGWLAIMSGSEYGPEIPALLEVRPLAGPRAPFSAAAEAFRRAIGDGRHI